MEQELLPCPFCGGVAKIDQFCPTWETTVWAAYCYEGCGAEIRDKNKTVAEKDWNRRVPAPPLSDV